MTRVRRDDDHEATNQAPGRIGALVVADFLRAIRCLGNLPKGPDLAMRRAWAQTPDDRPRDTRMTN